MSDAEGAVELDPLSSDDILRGIIFGFSILLVFVSFSSTETEFGLLALLISVFFLSALFWRGPIAVEPQYLFDRYADNLGYYLDKGEDYLCKSFNATKKAEKVLVGVAYNFFLVMAFVLPIDLLFQYLTRAENSLLFYQKFITWVIYVVESAFGIGVFIRGEHGTILSYDDMIDMEIVAECTGLHETVFLSMLIICFRGVKPMVRAKWAMYAIVFIFIENLIRIISGYPLIHIFGFSTWDKFHFFWWHTGQYALIMAIFVLWVMVVAGNPDNKSPRRNYIR
ncbi:MAG: exosortase/archaeosortase family protein [Candidatus Thermoplasmatota archaeon]|nr:exosortase/archaeosortase family protein [Candidatus Thermoplasmatota archaeon]MEE3242551.1 exosortase/archaeosortase family protein [Candidatus Thermoplasmatota archaeon]